MADRFYPGMNDLIEQLNLLDAQVQAGASGSVSAGCTSFNGRTGPISLSLSDITTALGFTPYNSSNPSGFQTASDVSTVYAPKASPSFTGTVAIPTRTAGDNSDNAASTKFCKRNVAQGAGTQSVTFASNIQLDCTSANVFDITLGGALTLTLANPVDGQRVVLRLKQDATGGRTLAFAANQVRYGSDITTLPISTAANKTDYIGLIYNQAAARWDVVSFVRGF